LDVTKRTQHVYAAELAGDVRYLIDALVDPDVRTVAARAIAHLAERGEIRDRSAAVRKLRRLLSANDAHTRASAVRALGKLGAKDAAADITQTAETDAVWWVRTWAITAIGEIAADDASGRLTQYLADDDHRIRWAALAGIRALGDPTTADAVARAKRNERWYRRGMYRKTIRLLRRAGRLR
jgi:HEAT repeat protein